ncbi:mitochondrial carrier [Xylaria acuta]|nr:mitochondrial carrier [Xylaria acuta]
MSADFWAGYISGAAGIIIGNPLDVKKVRLQAGRSPSSQTLPAGPTLSSHRRRSSPSSRPPASPLIPSTLHPLTRSTAPGSPSSSASSLLTKHFPPKSSLVAGTAAPILGYGFLNGILFAAYTRTEDVLNRALLPSASNISNSNAPGSSTTGSNLWATWLAGAVGGLSIWVISTPTELIKTKAQLASPSTAQTHFLTSNLTQSSSWGITCTILRREGIRGLYCGGVVTALRDSIGYGFYFWAYELCGRIMTAQLAPSSVVTKDGNSKGNGAEFVQETAKVLLCGGIAGVVTWASIYPLDVIKTRVQRQVSLDQATTPLLGTAKRKGAVRIAKDTYRQEGMQAFFRGFGSCSLRAFIVNAAQWGVYELVMSQLSQSTDREKESHY